MAPDSSIFDRLLTTMVKDVARAVQAEPAGAELFLAHQDEDFRIVSRWGQSMPGDDYTEILRLQMRVDDRHHASLRFLFPAGTNSDAFPPLPERVLADWARDLRTAFIPRAEEPKADAFATLLNVSQAISSSLSVKEVLHRIVLETLLLFQAKICALHLLEPGGTELRIETVYGSSLEYIQKPNVSVEGSVLGRAVRERRVIRVYDVQEEPLYAHRDLARREGLRSLLAAPLIFRDEVLGIIAVYSSQHREWTDEEAAWLEALAGQSAVAVRHPHHNEQIGALEESVRRRDRRSGLGELAAGVAHEIRNPLAILSMLAHSLKEEMPPESKHAEDIRLIAEKSEQMNRTLEEMTDLARTRPPELAPVSVNQVVQNTLLLLAPRVRAGHHDLRLELDEANPLAFADPARLAQVVLNLFLNAVEALCKSGRITIQTIQDGDKVRLSISDNGHGIPESIQQNLFRPFVTGRREGTGLGLSIVKRIVEDHGGSIYYLTGPEGTTFHILLPRAEPLPEPEEEG